MINYVILTASTNQAKTLSIVDGQLKKSSLANPISGKFTAHYAHTLQEFAEALTKFTPKQSLILGAVIRQSGVQLAVGESIGLCLKGKESEKSASRSKESIKNVSQAGLMLFDIDNNLGGIETLKAFIPELSGIGAVIKPSSGSGVYGPDGKEYAGARGKHIFIPVTDMSDIQRVSEVFWGRQWLAGHGHYLISNGIYPMLLERGFYDKSVLGQQERLAFEAKPILMDGLIQRDHHPIIIHGGLLNTSTIPDLTPDEIEQVKKLQYEARQLLRPEYKKVLTKKRAEFKGSEAEWDGLKTRELHFEFALDTVNGPLTVGQLGKKQDGLTMCDPFEPDYDGGSKTKAKFYWNDGNPIINSQAHGGIVYRIVKKTAEVDYAKNRYMLSSRLPVELFTDINESESGAKTIIPTLSNLKIMLNGYGISVIYDEAIKAQQILIPGDKSLRHDLHNEACYTQILALAELNRINRRIADLLPVLLVENTVNPVKDWILSQAWDGVPRIGDLCANLVVTDSKRDIYNKIIRTWLIQCCAALDRAEIGCRLNSKAQAKYELILVLQGAQGITKTNFFTKLLPTELNGEKFSTRYIKDGSNLSLDNKDSIKQNISCWINELGELDATFKKSDISALKAFCSNSSDVIRLAYARTECSFSRATSFCGTVNDELFLVDSTGSRRFGVIAVEAILERDIDMQQLWAEVWGLYASGVQWWLDKSTETVMQVSNADHQSINPVEDGILSKFDWDSEESEWVERMTMTEIYQACFDRKPNRTDLNAIKPFLIKCGVRIVMIHGAMIAYMPSVRRLPSSASDMPPMFS